MIPSLASLLGTFAITLSSLAFPVQGLVVLDNGEVLPGNVHRVDETEVELIYGNGRIVLQRRRVEVVSVGPEDDAWVPPSERDEDEGPDGSPVAGTPTPPPDRLVDREAGFPAPTIGSWAMRTSPALGRTPGESETGSSVPLVPYRLADAPVVLARPEGWRVDDQTGTVTFWERDPALGLGTASIVVIVTERTHDPAEALERPVGEGPVARRVRELLGSRGTVRQAIPDGQGGLRLDAEIRRRDRRIHLTVVIRGAPGRVVVATAVRPAERESLGALQEAALRSIRVEPDPEADEAADASDASGEETP